MNEFKPEYLNIDDLNLPSLSNSDIDFYEVEFYPVINIFDGKTGPVILDGKIRTFPLEALYSYNARQLSKDEFFKLFPETKKFFALSGKQAA